MRDSRRVAVAAVVVAAGLGVAACSAEQTAGQDAVSQGEGSFSFYSPGGATEIFYEEQERQPIQEFSGESLMEEGATVALSGFHDQVVVLNAWGQWCAPCRSEVDDLEETQEAIEPLGATVLGINVRDYNRQIAQDFVRDNAVTYPSLYDPPFRTAAALGGVPASVVPTTIVLDRQHRPAAVFLRAITAGELIDVVTRIEQE